jgi:DNA-binding CsgD family transcriptional regulator/PAS domain-containing protein
MPNVRSRQGWSAQALSQLIGSIYDCVLDPSRWHRTLDEINTAVECKSSIFYLFDRSQQKFTMMKIAGVDERYWGEVINRYGSDICRWAIAEEAAGYSIDEPRLMSQLPRTVFEGSRYAQEVLKPAQLIDILSLHLLMTPSRIASLGMARHESKGAIARREVEIAALLLPHLRRAVMIGDVLDLRAIERARMAEALDALRCGVVLIDMNATILHANSAAEHLLGMAGGPVQARGGKFSARSPSAARELRGAIKLATQDEANIGKTGLAVRLTEADEAPIFAHVLPLTGSDLRTRLQPTAVAAVFIGVSPDNQGAAAAAAAAFGLTPAETRVLASLVGGCSLVKAAAELGIAPTTAKWHLENVFAKTGVARQADLVGLAKSLAPPTRPRSNA